jgi:hypothetical protein
MRIETKIAADLVEMKKAKSPDGKEKIATLILRTTIDEKDALKKFGEAFHKAAFGARSTRDGKTSFLFKSLRPNIVLEKHMVTVLELGPLASTPKLAKIAAGADGDHVLVDIHVPIAVGKKSAAELWDALGETIDVTFDPQQMALPLAAAAEAAKAASKKAARKRK